MQNRKKCHENVWILSGTSDGPILSEKLLRHDYVVFVSVVTYKASTVYPQKNKLHIITGKLENEFAIQNFILKNEIKLIIDATHPFAQVISNKLISVCQKVQIPLFRYERGFIDNKKTQTKIIDDFKNIDEIEMQNKNILLAIGTRQLDDIARYYIDEGANVFARIIASPESILNAFSSCIKNSNIAILNPSKYQENNLELFICQNWKIDYVLCRESGGYSQRNWEYVSMKSDIKLFLLKRPMIKESKFLFSNYDDLIKKIDQLLRK